ncbi:hypothetical protein AB0B39_12270 [Micromonospora sp. NPDC049114]|uniref:hypothetical protein n=1 Tax=Micromonospora sp. NPDC049114 TaxID=3155498 RepID=UPI0033E24A83
MATIRRNGSARIAAAALSLAAAATLLLSTACTALAPTVPTPASTPSPRQLQTPETLLGKPKNMSRGLTNRPISLIEKLKQEVGTPTSAVAWAYGGETETADAVLVTGASGTVDDPAATLKRILTLYGRVETKAVDTGQFGGEARCGKGRGERGGYMTICGWADSQTAGLVVFVSDLPQGDPTVNFLTARSELERRTT